MTQLFQKHKKKISYVLFGLIGAFATFFIASKDAHKIDRDIDYTVIDKANADSARYSGDDTTGPGRGGSLGGDRGDGYSTTGGYTSGYTSGYTGDAPDEYF